ncbi:hypothetical protein [Ruegeria sp.]|uniref:hypothetical protein n=1 Tax=Ruegeria sp. TaxID=1879320 RepID=UPI00231F08D8|nr:hypothetical protein [Ruegeria sp.]MDA7963307.1 hypothetical protein [Ruegeria sp.]
MKQVISCTLAAMVALSVPVTADAGGRYGYQTVAINNTEFEVIPRSRRDVDGYWCAASDFARRTLGAGWQQRIYVQRGYGPSVTTGRKTAVQFSLTEPTNVAQQRSISAGFRPGYSMSVQGANGRCSRRQIFD